MAWRRIKDLPDGDAALWWLYAVARRVLANEYRRNRHRRSLLSQLRDTRPNLEPQPETVVVRRERDVAVVAALERLPKGIGSCCDWRCGGSTPRRARGAPGLLHPGRDPADLPSQLRRAAKEFRRLEHRTRAVQGVPPARRR